MILPADYANKIWHAIHEALTEHYEDRTSEGEEGCPQLLILELVDRIRDRIVGHCQSEGVGD